MFICLDCDKRKCSNCGLLTKCDTCVKNNKCEKCVKITEQRKHLSSIRDEIINKFTRFNDEQSIKKRNKPKISLLDKLKQDIKISNKKLKLSDEYKCYKEWNKHKTLIDKYNDLPIDKRKAFIDKHKNNKDLINELITKKIDRDLYVANKEQQALLKIYNIKQKMPTYVPKGLYMNSSKMNFYRKKIDYNIPKYPSKVSKNRSEAIKARNKAKGIALLIKYIPKDNIHQSEEDYYNKYRKIITKLIDIESGTRQKPKNINKIHIMTDYYYPRFTYQNRIRNDINLYNYSIKQSNIDKEDIKDDNDLELLT